MEDSALAVEDGHGRRCLFEDEPRQLAHIGQVAVVAREGSSRRRQLGIGQGRMFLLHAGLWEDAKGEGGRGTSNGNHALLYTLTPEAVQSLQPVFHQPATSLPDPGRERVATSTFIRGAAKSLMNLGVKGTARSLVFSGLARHSRLIT